MIDKNKKALILFTMVDNITNKMIEKLLSIFIKPEKVIDALKTNRKQIAEVLGEDKVLKLETISDELFSSYLSNLEKSNIKIVTIYDSEFPTKLFDLPDRPYLLYYKGDLNLANQDSIAVVGTRSPSLYARVVTEQFATKLASKGIVIVSGLATGIDKIAHESALKCGGKTIAVLGGGFNKIYPSLHTNLAKEIAEKGLLISEYRPNFSATTYTFPLRNRIIAGLSDGVLVAEAGEKSGSLHTKNYGIEYGKEIFAIPGNINNEKCKGSNRLIKTMQANCVTEPEDILIKFGINFAEAKPKTIQGNITENLILDALSEGEQTLEKLQEITKLETKVLNSQLTMMQIRGLIKKLPGNSYIK